MFVDSSHVVKTGSDVLHLFNEVLPILPVGAYIHFHDIYIPDDYPSEWRVERRAWNESYFLQCFLMYNSDFEIVFGSHLSVRLLEPELQRLSRVVGVPCRGGGSFWLKRIHRS